MIVQIVETLRAEYGNSADLARVSQLDLQRLPWTRIFVLRGTEGEFRRCAERRHVAGSGHCASDIYHRETHGAADRRIGLISRPERVVAGIHVEFFGDRTVDND